MSSPGLLCLKWNNHTSAFDKLLYNLYLKDVYSDGTIVCHGKFYPVHRFVLSTCSEYFEEIFRQSINLKSKHPFIIVKDIHPPQMEALLNYMYRGEVNVPQEMLPELVKAAEAFKIKGLAVPDDEPPPSKSFSSRDRKRSGANLSSPSSHIKKSRRMDDSSKSAKISSKSDDEIKHSGELQTERSRNMPKNYSSSSSQKNADEFFAPEILPSEVKSEPTDLPEYKEPVETAQSEDDYLSPKELGIKDEKSFESYTTAETFPPFKDDVSLPADDQYDLAQSSSWDNSQAFEGDSNLEEDDSAQGILGHPQAGTKPNQDYLWNTSQHPPQIFSSNLFFKCFCCSYQSKWKKDLERHYSTHTGEKPFKCTQCPYQATLKSNLQNHMKKHTGEKPFKCTQCPYEAIQKAHIQNHMKKHTGEKPFKCTQCPYKAIQKAHIQSHMKKHTGEKPFLCQFCEYKSAFKNALQQHLNRHHGI